ncbi:caspase-7-like [Tribolium castaneum]|uniref:Caspase Nc-like Protein n=1 Tax=Tribolium castaneum TaxID=7070 RepID=D6X3B4_TRICA|nr:PREDICTED: caspase-7-like [Tribolium castaneum]XP_015839205.1 PREDICTED: caspase-7-like [Tribolium castaneum]EFA10767.2 Caspase Nc-like Protein [Tribolium castaneum]|eukprot:XP_008198054.1 PREDICTED: caspase-7-like [Tribolium castaneum]
MWSKKNNEKDEKTVGRTTQTQVTRTSQTVTIRTIAQHSQTISVRNNNGSIQSSTSLLPLNLNSSSHLPLPNARARSSSTSYAVDAKPINVNYRSPYQAYSSNNYLPSTLGASNFNRNSPVYSSYQPPRPQTALPPVLPGTVQPKPETASKDKKLVVKKTGKFYDGACAIPTYATHSKHRGEVLIINNIMFKEKGYRHGAKADHENLKSVFKQMGFKVTFERDLRASSMASAIKSFSQKSSLKTADIAVVVIMSHGTRSETIMDTEVFGLDDKSLLVEDILSHFNEDNCKSMKGKPKIFIFQCCRGDNEQFLQSDAIRTTQKASVLADALIAYSTLPGFVSHRDPQSGTWYISTLCEVFCQHAHEYHVEDLLKMVDVKLTTFASGRVRQTTHYESRGFKRCYLHPV